MENEMTDYQFRVVLKMIREMLKGSRDLQEAQEALENLLKDDGEQTLAVAAEQEKEEEKTVRIIMELTEERTLWMVLEQLDKSSDLNEAKEKIHAMLPGKLPE